MKNFGQLTFEMLGNLGLAVDSIRPFCWVFKTRDIDY